jgi:hypothetical protein
VIVAYDVLAARTMDYFVDAPEGAEVVLDDATRSALHRHRRRSSHPRPARRF